MRHAGTKANAPHCEEQSYQDQPPFLPTHSFSSATRLYSPYYGRPRWRTTRSLSPPWQNYGADIDGIFPKSHARTLYPLLSPTSKCDCKVANLGRSQVNYVIECCKYHQHQDNRETDPKTHLLGPLR